MAASHHSPDTGNAVAAGTTGFVRIGSADASTVGRLREEFSDWMRTRLELDNVRFSDVVLAVYEALSNAAEFAYAGGPDGETATLTMQAQHTAATGTLVVTVTDRGQWRHSDSAGQQMSRGRGIPLMRALADRADIEPSAHGTRVRLQFDNCAESAGEFAGLTNRDNGNRSPRDGCLPAPALQGDGTLGDQVWPGDGVGAR